MSVSETPGAGKEEDYVIATFATLFPGTSVAIVPRGEESGSVRHDFLVLPASRKPRLIVPVAPGRTMAAAVAPFSSSMGASQLVMRAFAAGGFRVGLGGLVPTRLRATRRSPDGPPSIEDHLTEILGEDVSVAVSIGPPRANRKPVLRVLDRRGNSVAFAKLGTSELTGELVAKEGRALARVNRIAWDRLRVPEVIHAGKWGDTQLLVLSPIGAEGRRQKVDDPRRLAAIEELSSAFGVISGPLGESEFLVQLRTRCAALAPGTLRERYSELLAVLVEKHSDDSLDYGAWHGDFTPWNMAHRAGPLQVWDWEQFGLDVPLGMDELHHSVHKHTQRHGFSEDNITAGLANSRWPVADASQRNLLEITYLAALGMRYVSSSQYEGGLVVRPAAQTLLASLASRLDRGHQEGRRRA